MNCWLSVERKTAPVVKTHGEHPNFRFARSVGCLPELLVRTKADLSLISQLPSRCLKIMLRREMTSHRGSPREFLVRRTGFWLIKIWRDWSTDRQLSPRIDPKHWLQKNQNNKNSITEQYSLGSGKGSMGNVPTVKVWEQEFNPQYLRKKARCHRDTSNPGRQRQEGSLGLATQPGWVS